MFLSLLASLRPFNACQMQIDYEISQLAKKSPNIKNALQSSIYLIVYSLNCITHIFFSNSFEPQQSSHRRSISLSNFMYSFFFNCDSDLVFLPQQYPFKNPQMLQNQLGFQPFNGFPAFNYLFLLAHAASTQHKLRQPLLLLVRYSCYYYPPHECP